ncbi:glycoside hydrolase family 3 N-terminal domain-containing protein [Thermodesulfovibrio sp. 1176]|uniref:glycoside hydrolase family 3 N-terminal domain-containing protein n=1 Tax=Thermodesulfovibrio sp. 1176 TaxID=3043424 RepID=UPI002482B55C|nr:glycoside hydrolase family 3 N-terminal domain-containing protein [Thermodesulfovibrio sp. 1176]MDI1472469.1 glycoside hydrolase family 3 N-terminal domain-containing protein [Thermodesulfovibrio sp. 1176]
MKNLQRKILNLIFARLDGDKINDKIYVKYIEKLVKDGIGGFVLFGGKYEEIKNFISYIQSLSSRRLIISSDIERGVGQQIKDATIIPSQMGITAGFDISQNKIELETIYLNVIKEAIDVGINLALLPVLDVNTEPENPIICTRAFSDNSEIVSEYGCFVIEKFESCGLKTCGKHFPGHGCTVSDSHLELPIFNGELESHLKPFKAAIKKNVSSIMIGHLLIPELDEMPSTLSEKIINKLLRQDLSFNGVVMTDAMNMKALENYKNPCTLAFKAGADIILHPEDPYKSAEEIKNAYEKGFISDKRIQSALIKVETIRHKINNQNLNTLKDPLPQSLNLVEVFKKTVTVIKNEINHINKYRVVSYLTGNYNEEIKKIFMKYFTTVDDLENLNKKDENLPLIAIFTDIGFGKTHTLNNSDIVIIKNFIKKNDAIVVSFGNPYVLKFFNNAKTIVALYDSNEFSVRAFLENFKEGLKESGRLPVRIPWSDE